MLKTIILTCFLIAFFTFDSKAQDFWEQLSLPNSVVPLKVDFNSEGHVYLLTLKGLYKSIDEGETWLNLGLNLTESSTKDIEVTQNNTIYLGVDPWGYFYFSNNDGQSWDSIFTSIQGMIVLRLIGNQSLLLAGTWGGIYKSIDSGYTWTQVLSTVNVEVFNDIIEKDSFLFAGSTHFMSSTGGGVYRSADEGNTWEHISMAGHGVSSFALDIDGNLLAGTQLNYFGVYRSGNNGIIWQKILSGHVVTSLAVDGFGGIYAGCNSDFGPSGVRYSDDNGLTWSSLNSGFHPNSSITSLAISTENYIYATTINPNYLYRSVNPIVAITEKHLDKLSIELYPNPCSQYILLKIKNEIATMNKLNIQIRNLMGILVYEKYFMNDNNNYFEINVANLKAGIYYYSLEVNGINIDSKKMIIY